MFDSWSDAIFRMTCCDVDGISSETFVAPLACTVVIAL